ncbi:hypothetical protein [Dyella sp. Tek66A03]|uniref:hypothetical protein n=1 Tax=Dyella sp. Tek66A03 TaxID=3458298 RepID=UPI00403E6761
MKPAIEITSFKLAKGVSLADFVRANADVDPWLRQQPGFVSRMLTQQDDGTIADIVIWERASQARSSAQRLMRELADSPVHSAIEQRTVQWSVAPIVHMASNKKVSGPIRDQKRGRR